VKKLLLLLLIICNISFASENDDIIKNFFPKQVDVFGVKILALEKTPDKSINKAKSILSQWLDNDNDGKPDNQLVVDSLVKNNCAMAMGKSIRKIDSILDKKLGKKGISREQTQGMFALASKEPNIAYLEEILHLVTDCGYANAYPEIFGEYKGTKIALAMDKARGGYFEKIPKRYPKGAWYTYDDRTCDYSCMVTEYFFWSLTSYLGAQKNRYEEISEEWKLNSKKKMKKDELMMKLITNPEYKIPKKLPSFK